MKRSIYVGTILLFFLLLSSIPSLAQPVLFCGETTFDYDGDNFQRDYLIPNDPSVTGITFTLKGANGGNANLRNGIGCTNLNRKGGEGATVTVTFAVGDGPSATHLARGGRLRFIVGESGANSLDDCWATAQGSGGGSSGIAYLPPNHTFNSNYWYILAVAGAGGGGILASQQKHGEGAESSSQGWGGASNGSGGSGIGAGGGVVSDGEGDSVANNEDGGGKFLESVGEAAGLGSGYDGSYTYLRGKPLANPGAGGIDPVNPDNEVSIGAAGFTGGGAGIGNFAGGGGGFSGGKGDENQGTSGGSWYTTQFGASNATVTAGSDGVGSGDGSITVTPNVPIIAQCQNVTVQLDNTGNGNIYAADFDNNTETGCYAIGSYYAAALGEFALNIPAYAVNNPIAVTCSDIGTHSAILNINLIGRDPVSCNATVTVTDPAPVANCKNTTVYLDNAGNGSIVASDIDNGSTGICGIASTSVSQNTFDCTDKGYNDVTLTVTSTGGSVSTCIGRARVVDLIAPVAQCQDVTLSLNNLGYANLSPAYINNNSSDACGLTAASLSHNIFFCSDIGTTTVTLTITDSAANTSSCSASVTTQDNTAPDAQCKNVTLQLDDTGNVSISPEDVDNNSSAACGIASMTLNKYSYNCSNVGSLLVRLTVEDNNANTSSCIGVVTIQDNVPPFAQCFGTTVFLDDTGNGSTSTSEINFNSNDACGVASLSLSQTSFDCTDVGFNTITMTVTDNESNTSTCTAEVVVYDHVPPTVVCKDATVQLRNSGNTGSVLDVANEIHHSSADACGVMLIYASETDFTCSDIGDVPVTLTAVDANSYTATCKATVTVEDNIAPIAICKDFTVKFNGENDLPLFGANLWDEVNSYENCGPIYYLGLSVDQVTCDQLGSIVPVVVSVEDARGNASDCTSNVTIDGLPCGWTVSPDGIDCTDSEANYDTENATFSLTSEECYSPYHYRPADLHAFIKRPMCGDGSIVAEIVSVTGNGWAGISMRESSDPTAPMVQLMLDGTGLTRREARMSAGGTAFAHLFQTQGKNWLKLQRVGQYFSAYHSSDGINWATVFASNIPMSNCIEIGMITMNADPSSTVTGVFGNVNFGGSAVPLNAPQGVDIANPVPLTQEVEVYPNPFSYKTTIQYEVRNPDEVAINVMDMNGRQVNRLLQNDQDAGLYQVEWDGSGHDGRQLPSGLYLLQIRIGNEIFNKKVLLQDE